jgi:hypothetical protein
MMATFQAPPLPGRQSDAGPEAQVPKPWDEWAADSRDSLDLALGWQCTTQRERLQALNRADVFLQAAKLALLL